MQQSSPSPEWSQITEISRSKGAAPSARTTSSQDSWPPEMVLNARTGSQGIFEQATEEARVPGAIQSHTRTSVMQNWKLIRHWRDTLITEIAAYIDRSHGWDGYQALPINGHAIDDVIRFISRLADDIPRPLDQPCADGEVSLVWRYGTYFAEIGFPGDQTFYWYCTDGTSEGSDDDVPVNNGIPIELTCIMGFPAAPSGRFKSSHAPKFYRDQPLAA